MKGGVREMEGEKGVTDRGREREAGPWGEGDIKTSSV